MQQAQTRKEALKGLSSRELEAHTRVELLPDRLVMRRRRQIRLFGPGCGNSFICIKF
jgi:hypothetical protein